MSDDTKLYMWLGFLALGVMGLAYLGFLAYLTYASRYTAPTTPVYTVKASLSKAELKRYGVEVEG